MGKIGGNFRCGTWRKSRSKKEVIDEARTVGRKKFISASLMGICHLKNAEIGGKTPKSTKGRVVLRGDIVKRTIQGLMQYLQNKDLQHHK